MQFSMLYSGEQNLSFKSCLIFYAGDSLKFLDYRPCKFLLLFGIFFFICQPIFKFFSAHFRTKYWQEINLHFHILIIYK